MIITQNNQSTSTKLSALHSGAILGRKPQDTNHEPLIAKGNTDPKEQKALIEAPKSLTEPSVSVSLSSRVTSSFSRTSATPQNPVVPNNSSETNAVSQTAAIEPPPKPENPYANTILKAIEGQLRLDIADGAQLTELQTRLDAGLSGFLEGFNDAFNQLSALPAFSDDIKSEVLGTKEHVLSGLAALADELGLDKSAITEAQKALEGEQKIVTSRQEASKTTGVGATDFNPLGALSGFHAEEKGFKFTLTTADGDKIEVLANSLKAVEVIKDAQSLQAKSDASHQFSLSVKGDLDEEELSAINKLLDQVNKVSESFFNGNVEQAFDQALNMGFDSQEIVDFSLKLTHSTQTQVKSNYGASAYEKGAASYDAAPAPSKNLVHLGRFLDELEKANSLASDIGQSLSIIGELADTITQSRQLGEPRIKHFIDQLPAQAS